MTVVAKVYGHISKLVEQGTIDLSTDTIKVALFNDTHAFDITDTTWADIKANEITGTGYSEGGATLTHTGAKLVETPATGLYSFGENADDTEWSASTLTAYNAVVYKYIDDAGVPDDASPILASIAFGAAKSTIDDIFKITWPATGIFRFRVNPS